MIGGDISVYLLYNSNETCIRKNEPCVHADGVMF